MPQENGCFEIQGKKRVFQPIGDNRKLIVFQCLNRLNQIKARAVITEPDRHVELRHDALTMGKGGHVPA